MKTLYETIMHDPGYSEFLETNPGLSKILDQAEIFNIQNVADYWFLMGGMDSLHSLKDGWDALIPNAAPPFPVFWMEYKMPFTLTMEGKTTKNQSGGYKIGSLLASFSTETLPTPVPVEAFHNAKWVTALHIFFSEEDNLYKPTPFILATIYLTHNE